MSRILIVPVDEPAKMLSTDPWMHVQKMLGGHATLQMVTLHDGVTMICDEEGPMKGLPLNRNIPDRRPQLPEADAAFLIDTTGGSIPAPGEMGIHRVHGYFVLARLDPKKMDGADPYIDLTNEDVWKYCNLLNERWRVR